MLRRKTLFQRGSSWRTRLAFIHADASAQPIFQLAGSSLPENVGIDVVGLMNAGLLSLSAWLSSLVN
jgi:hypothetical protein